MEIPQECFDMSMHSNASYQYSLKSFKSKSELEALPRKDLQQLAKQYGVKANLKNMDIINQLLLIEPSLFGTATAAANDDDSMISGLKRDESEEKMVMSDVASEPNMKKRRKSNNVNGKDQGDQENVNPNSAALILPNKSKKQSAIKADKEITQMKRQEKQYDQHDDDDGEAENMKKLELSKRRKFEEQEEEARKQKELEMMQKAKQEEEEAKRRKEVEELEMIKRLKEEEEIKRKLREEEEERQKEMEIKKNKMDFFPIVLEAAKESVTRQQMRYLMKQSGVNVAAFAVARNNLKSYFSVCAKEASKKAVERLQRREIMKKTFIEASMIGSFRMNTRILFDLCIKQAVEIGKVKSYARFIKFEMEKQLKVIAMSKHLIRMGKREAAKMGMMKTLKRKASYEVAIKAIERMEEYERLLKSIQMVESLLVAYNNQSKLINEFISIRNEKEEYIKLDML